MKVLTILGARPQFIKASSVSRAIRARDNINEVIVHTGQHFDENMSGVFFAQLNIPEPKYSLGIGGVSHGSMTGRMLEKLELLIQHENPTCVLVYGDTNSTLAGALAAVKLNTPIAHVEAGLRSHNMAMPEEINRVLTDRVSTLLLCPTESAVKNLEQEGFPFRGWKDKVQLIENIGDVMLDAVLHYRDQALGCIGLESFGLSEKNYALCTLHRQENTDNPTRLTSILNALAEIAHDITVVLPLHPRTRARLGEKSVDRLSKILMVLEPLSYLEMQRLEMSARLILTDSGGVQKEAHFHQVPCITLRDETEWVETLEADQNRLVGADSGKIIRAWESIALSGRGHTLTGPFGTGRATEGVLKALLSLEGG